MNQIYYILKQTIKIGIQIQVEVERKITYLKYFSLKSTESKSKDKDVVQNVY